MDYTLKRGLHIACCSEVKTLIMKLFVFTVVIKVSVENKTGCKSGVTTSSAANRLICKANETRTTWLFILLLKTSNISVERDWLMAGVLHCQ